MIFCMERAGADDLEGDEGDDILYGGAGADDLEGDEGNDILYGEDGADDLEGNEGDDVLDGGAGNDYLEGGIGNDTYLFGPGSGQDYIYDEDEDDAGDVDTVQFSDGVSATDVVLSGNEDDLYLTIGDTGDRLIVGDWFYSDEYKIEQFIFSDSTIWDIATINSQNKVPLLSNIISDQQVFEDAAFSFTISSDSFIDADTGDVLTYSASLNDDSALPDWLSFDAATQTFSGTPDNGDVGAIDVKVTASDGTASASDVFTLSVNNTNDAPVAQDNAGNTALDTAIIFTAAELLDNDTDVDSNDTLIISAVNNAVNGSVVLNTDGTITFTPTAGYSGDATFDYTVDDGNGGTDSATVTVDRECGPTTQ